jgi:hypothetical protein
MLGNKFPIYVALSCKNLILVKKALKIPSHRTGALIEEAKAI